MMPTPQQLRERITYNEETGSLTWLPIPNPSGWQISWNGRCADKPALNHISVRGYYCGTWRPYSLNAHRVAWAIHYGKWPEGNLDHINGDKLDNRISNLRVVTTEQNARNMAKGSRNKSGCIGVHRHSAIDAWIAQIRSNGKTVHLGSYKCLTAAIVARAKAERQNDYHENHGRAAVAAMQGEIDF